MKKGWEIKKLGDLYDITSSKRVFESEWKDEGVPFYRAREIVKLAVNGFVNNELYISDDMYNSYSEKYGIPKAGDIMVTGVGTLGICYVVKQDDKFYFKDGNIIWLKKKENVNSRYVEFAFQSNFLRKQIEDNIGATVGTYTIIRAKNTLIPIPPLSIQQEIVSILEETFEAIAQVKANAEQNLKNAKALFESYLQSVFENKGGGWEEKRLSDLCSIKHGFAFEGKYFSDNGDYVLLTPGNFYESGGYRDRGDKQKYYNGKIPSDYILNKGDLLVAMTEQAAGLLGSPILVPESNKFLHNQRLGLVIPKPNVNWLNEFFFYVFNTRRVRKGLHDSGTGVKVRHTSPSKIGEILISYPTSIDAQIKIVANLDKLALEIKRLEAIFQQKLKDVEELKKAILEKAFKGELTGRKVVEI